MSPEELTAIAEAFPIGMREPWLLAGYTGMRIGEVIGLTWAAVGLAERLLTIERTENNGEEAQADSV